MRRKREGTLTAEEKRAVKGLLAEGWRNQDIQALVNFGREATINSARITEVKKNGKITLASIDELAFYKARKQSFDLRTGLNLFDDERLIRAREAMILAVQVFNSPSLSFKTEVFCVLANIAWTYLMHEYFRTKKVSIVNETGLSLSLLDMMNRSDCPLSDGSKKNLEAIKKIRDTVEHHLLRRSDPMWFSLFQACCLNFEKILCQFFGDAVSLRKELSFALQFARLSMDQLTTLQKFDVPEVIETLDAQLIEGLREDQINDIEYQFKVVFTLDASSKSRAHIQFVHPSSGEAEEIRNVLIKYKPADELYPYKPTKVTKLVVSKTGKPFTNNTHANAWRKYKAIIWLTNPSDSARFSAIGKLLGNRDHGQQSFHRLRPDVAGSEL
jgi:hypothetical protein